MADFNTFLSELNKNRNILREREAKYGGEAPIDLLNQLEDHDRAIRLTRQAIAGEITEAEWREALKPLLVAISDRQSKAARVVIGDVAGNITNAIIAGRDVTVENLDQRQSTFNQQGQTVEGDQYNAAGDITIAVPDETPMWRRLSHLNIIVGLVVGLVIVTFGSAAVLEISLADLFFRAAAPAKMAGHINILITEPVVASPGSTDAQIRVFQVQYTRELSAALREEFAPYGKSLDLNPEIRVEAVPVEDISRRHEVMAARAEAVGAHIVLYGVLDKGTYSPEFYIHPRFATQGAELTGPDAVGKPVNIPLSGQGADQIQVHEALRVPLAHLSAFVGALGLFQARAYDRAQRSFETLVNEEWATEEGKAVLYLWLGTTHYMKAAQSQLQRGQPATPVYCLVAEREVPGGHAECARRSYEKAGDTKEDFPRAYIGLGNYWLDLQKVEGCTRFEDAVSWYELAEEKRKGLSGEDARFAEIALVRQKILYHLGLTYARALEEDIEEECNSRGFYKDRSLSILTELVTYYNNVPDEEKKSNSLLRDLTSRAYYMMGLVQHWSGDDDKALQHFQSTGQVALADDEKDRVNLDPWQSIYWTAQNQIGAIYVTRYENGEDARFNLANNTLRRVTTAYDNEDFGRWYDDEPFVASAAWYYLGRLYGIKAERSGGGIDTGALGEAEAAYLESIKVLDDPLKNDPQLVYNREDGLPWISHLNLGDLYRRWSTIDAGKTAMAMEQYRLVLDALNTGKFKGGGNNELRLEAYDRVYLGMGAIHLANKQIEQAREKLEEVCFYGQPGSTLVQEAGELLKQISDETACY